MAARRRGLASKWETLSCIQASSTPIETPNRLNIRATAACSAETTSEARPEGHLRPAPGLLTVAAGPEFRRYWRGPGGWVLPSPVPAAAGASCARRHLEKLSGDKSANNLQTQRI